MRDIPVLHDIHRLNSTTKGERWPGNFTSKFNSRG
jgi:hypothetical protein